MVSQSNLADGENLNLEEGQLFFLEKRAWCLSKRFSDRNHLHPEGHCKEGIYIFKTALFILCLKSF